MKLLLLRGGKDVGQTNNNFNIIAAEGDFLSTIIFDMFNRVAAAILNVDNQFNQTNVYIYDFRQKHVRTGKNQT